ncbi:GNAT family N-acetyltransferase [Mucilaginibacter sp. X4EP1]|uniref:GNAT family N-acetyltransferase n=1 Tax=Mucilaginibacter sp. X4EP1 TaxID=2723092 RepID=UPI00216A84D6|nr:GNAT family N-acetyltransferase [Mucilaginibacter sp. X4EP1]MCS3815388.1 hypothetical protein [Mucilaginibacter sp. X4EP1]
MITIRKVQLTDADALLAFSKRTFYESFAHLNDPANMKAYSDKAFMPQRIQDELTTPGSEFYFALFNNQLAGYIKINFASAQTELKDETALEVERIYVAEEHQGKKIGKLLLNHATDIALKNRLSYIWLGVWEHNKKAIGFYQRNGFLPFSQHDFYLGNDKQIDLLFKKKLN